jgi:hypothetical protein
MASMTTANEGMSRLTSNTESTGSLYGAASLRERGCDPTLSVAHENVLAYLPAHQHARIRRKLREAYAQPTYEKAKAALGRVRAELAQLNASAAASLDEGLEETLTLHRLGLQTELSLSFATTNCIESVNALVEQRTAKIDYWKTSDQKQRWLAAALLDIEPRHLSECPFPPAEDAGQGLRCADQFPLHRCADLLLQRRVLQHGLMRLKDRRQLRVRIGFDAVG